MTNTKNRRYIMESYDIYKDIAQRTQGDIYIGVVGPVRTGKSTFIKRFMDLVVIPNIENEYKRERALDELPQSAGGRMIMTTEPKFVPNEAVEISVGDNISLKTRLIDCVGYIVDSALGHIENEMPRMVRTPWSDSPMPFAAAAEMGTKKVINEHSTVGIVVTTDGSITDIDREDYVNAEERVISELQNINKPFIVILNTTTPNSESTQELKEQLSEKYGVGVLPINCMELSQNDVNTIMRKLLVEFSLTEIGVTFPDWINALDDDNLLKCNIREAVVQAVDKVSKISDAETFAEAIQNCEYVERASVANVDLGTGSILVEISTPQELFYSTVCENTGFDIKNDEDLIRLLEEMAVVKKEYDKIAPALAEVENKGYGIVSPSIDELALEEPEIIKQGGRYGVRLKASAPSIHMIRADIETEVNPIVGTEKQSEELVHYLLKEFETDPKKLWESNIFGTSLHELVTAGLHNKLYRMPEDARFKLQETLQKIINEGSGGLICIIL